MHCTALEVEEVTGGTCLDGKELPRLLGSMEMPATRWRLIFGECGALQRWGKPSRSCNERERQALDHALGDDARRTAIVATSMGAPPKGGGVPGENLGMDPVMDPGMECGI